MSEPACLGKWRAMSDPKWSKAAEIYCARCPIRDVCSVSDPGVSGPDGWVPSIGDDVLRAAAVWLSLRQREGQDDDHIFGAVSDVRVCATVDRFPRFPATGAGPWGANVGV